MNEAALRVSCAFVCLLVCVVMSVCCVWLCFFNVVQRPAPPAAPFVTAHLFVPVCAHGGFQGFGAWRSDATSALDPGLGSGLLGT